MMRLLVATVATTVVFGSVWALAAGLDAGSAIAATGQGTVTSCGDVTGSTFILVGRSVIGDGRDLGRASQEIGFATDVTKTYGVNIEVPDTCVVVDRTGGDPDSGVNLDVQVKAGADVVGSGSCEVQSHGGLGSDESAVADNTPGCTVMFQATADIAPIDALVVTET